MVDMDCPMVFKALYKAHALAAEATLGKNGNTP